MGWVPVGNLPGDDCCAVDWVAEASSALLEVFADFVFDGAWYRWRPVFVLLLVFEDSKLTAEFAVSMSVPYAPLRDPIGWWYLFRGKIRKFKTASTGIIYIDELMLMKLVKHGGTAREKRADRSTTPTVCIVQPTSFAYGGFWTHFHQRSGREVLGLWNGI